HGPPGDVLRRVDVDDPVPGPGELRLRVRAAGIGLPDALMCRGSYPFSPTLPFVPGQEVCGTVDAVGSGVDLSVGTRLMAVTNFFDGRGGFAEATVARSENAFRVPDDMRDEDAAAFRIGYSTAFIGLVRRGAVQPGEWLLVLGAGGGSGLAAMQLGAALGARVIAIVAGEAKRELCASSGADVVIDRTAGSVRDAVLEATGGSGVDVVYDPVGGALAAATARCLASGGRLLAVGFASGSWVEPDVSDLVLRNASVVGVYAGAQTRAEAEADHEQLLTLAADGRLGHATRVVPFGALADALGAVDRAEAVGKLVLKLDDAAG
ncbi:MAG TPA: NADPH:quinone oxidoreductase family protein, partial [Acidimicrobiales bacterium]|nr:NADPH:quinone oxidoreductase family protein [Acidimicrobiales bacterium]